MSNRPHTPTHRPTHLDVLRCLHFGESQVDLIQRADVRRDAVDEGVIGHLAALVVDGLALLVERHATSQRRQALGCIASITRTQKDRDLGMAGGPSGVGPLHGCIPEGVSLRKSATWSSRTSCEQPISSCNTHRAWMHICDLTNASPLGGSATHLVRYEMQ